MTEIKYLTIEEVAEILRVNKRTVYRLAVKGEIPAIRFGKSWRINFEELEEFLKKEIENERRS
jgi:excisionase family DNA binding protein